MIESLHRKYVENWSEDRFNEMISKLHPNHDPTLDFRIAETPVFVPESFKGEMLHLFEDIKLFLEQPDLAQKMSPGLPESYRLPNLDAYPSFVAVDMAVCDEEGKLVPRLIEVQGISSLYFYQKELNKAYQGAFELPTGAYSFFDGMNEEQYIATLREIIVGGYEPKNVVLMDIQPETQKTRIDFQMTERDLGIRAVCVSKIHQKGNKLYYDFEGEETPIHCIFNRFIFDELERRDDITPGFDMKADLEVEWKAHPNWYFLVSKYCLPFMESDYVPKATFLSDFKGDYPADLENYVLKPLYSFAGVGVEFDVTLEKLEKVEKKEDYMLQRKVNYAACVPTKDVPAKVELRLLCVWDEKGFRPLLTLARLSKGKILGVDFNKDKTWVGSSTAFFIPGF